jgi:ParB family chromosome partitioning protein
MAFPPSTYTDRGGVGSVERWSAVASLIEPQDGAAPEKAEPETADTSDQDMLTTEEEPVPQAA